MQNLGEDVYKVLGPQLGDLKVGLARWRTRCNWAEFME